ncbi:hypothetical protein [Neisseria shayeganii]|uniref:Uncharacterized protein n=1 Tax=Neisseria shayeganii TaxID=607712 RepID=A0A7D7NAL0_9NEIS|nr:hypothetical protein [Neisseria shayeganii]QMT39616.1 hypothetical protein H3L94_06960 [Neisseria shayeganii]
MKIDKPFRSMSLAEYRHYIARHARYTDFNPLGLYRSILENPALDTAGQQEVLALANRYFQKFYDFLVVKDLPTYARLSRLGQAPLSEAQERQYLEQLRRVAEKRLAGKDIRHWRVGVYSTSERFNGRLNDDGSPQTVAVMSRRRSQKMLKTAHIPHQLQRKNQYRIIKQAFGEYGQNDDEAV